MAAIRAEKSRAGFFRRRIILPLLELLRQGITPEKIALCIGVGIALGVFPVVGATTLLCTLAAVLLRLNLPAIQLVNYLIYPLQLVLLLPFMHLGERLFGGGTVRFSLQQILAMIRSDLGQALVILWGATLRAILVWLCISPFAVLILYLVLTPLIRKIPLPRTPADSTAA